MADISRVIMGDGAESRTPPPAPPAAKPEKKALALENKYGK